MDEEATFLGGVKKAGPSKECPLPKRLRIKRGGQRLREFSEKNNRGHPPKITETLEGNLHAKGYHFLWAFFENKPQLSRHGDTGKKLPFGREWTRRLGGAQKGKKKCDV